MFDEDNSKCAGCGNKAACAVETRTVGLDQITPSPTLIGPKAQRCPAINISIEGDYVRFDSPTIPTKLNPTATATATAPSQKPVVTDSRSEEILVHLRGSFKRSVIEYRDKSGMVDAYSLEGIPSPILWQSSKGGQFTLRFTRPSPEIASRLKRIVNGHYLPDDMPVSEAKELIDLHANSKLHP